MYCPCSYDDLSDCCDVPSRSGRCRGKLNDSQPRTNLCRNTNLTSTPLAFSGAGTEVIGVLVGSRFDR
jgi:hypothetical protein